MSVPISENSATSLSLAAAALREGRTADSLGILRRAIAEDDQHFEAWQLLGAACAAAGDFGASVEAMRRCVTLQPQLARARFNLAYALYQAGRVEEARPEVLECLKLDPLYGRAQYLLGEIGVPAPPDTVEPEVEEPPVVPIVVIPVAEVNEGPAIEEAGAETSLQPAGAGEFSQELVPGLVENHGDHEPGAGNQSSTALSLPGGSEPGISLGPDSQGLEEAAPETSEAKEASSEQEDRGAIVGEADTAGARALTPDAEIQGAETAAGPETGVQHEGAPNHGTAAVGKKGRKQSGQTAKPDPPGAAVSPGGLDENLLAWLRGVVAVGVPLAFWSSLLAYRSASAPGNSGEEWSSLLINFVQLAMGWGMVLGALSVLLRFRWGRRLLRAFGGLGAVLNLGCLMLIWFLTSIASTASAPEPISDPLLMGRSALWLVFGAVLFVLMTSRRTREALER